MLKVEPTEELRVLAIASFVNRRASSIRARTPVIFPLQTDADGPPLRAPTSPTSHPFVKRVIHLEMADFFAALSLHKLVLISNYVILPLEFRHEVDGCTDLVFDRLV